MYSAARRHAGAARLMPCPVAWRGCWVRTAPCKYRAAWTATASPGTARQNRCGHESAIGPSFTDSHDKVRPTNKRTQVFTRLLLRQGFKAWSSTIILSKVKAWSSTIILAIPATISKNFKTYLIKKNLFQY